MFTAETFEYEENDIALAQRGSPAVGMVVRGVQRVERSLVEKFLINDRLVAERPDQAERVAQDQVRFQVGGRIEGRVTEGDRPCLAAEPAADAAHDQSDRNGQHGEVNAEIGPSVFNPRGHRFDTAVNPHHRGNQQRAPQDDIPVLGQTFEDDRSGVVVIMQVGEFVRGEPFAGVMEIDAVGGVDDQRERIGNGVEPEQYSLIPSCFAEPERQQRQQDEQRVDVQDRSRIEHARTAQQSRYFIPLQRADQSGVLQVENDPAKKPQDVKQRQPQQERSRVVFQESL